MGEPEGVSHSTNSKNQSLNKIIDNMTSDLQSYDGQYIVLGAPGTAPTNTQHIWPDYTSQTGQPVTGVPVHNPVFVQQPYEIQDRMMQASQHGLFYPNPPSIRETSGEMIGMVDVGGGNFVNVVINPTNPPNTIHPFIPAGLHAESNMGFVHYQQSHNQPPHVLNAPSVSSEYGLFKTSNETPNQNNHQLIENVVGNWLPNKSGTYSPFGNVPQAYKTEDSATNLPGQLKKPRIVAEVRPMRPTYSDVLAKSVPPLTPPPTAPKTPTLSGSLKNDGKKQNSKGAKGPSCGGSKTMNSNPLKRQYSNEEQAQSVKCWISIDDLTTQSEEKTFINYEGNFDENIGSCSDNFAEPQSEENKKEKKQRKKNKCAEDKCEALNNSKSSGTINGTGKRPLHINNNLQSKDLSPEKNVTQTTDKNPRSFQDDHKKGTNNFSYVGGGTNKYNAVPEEKGPSVARVSKGGGSSSSGPRKNHRSSKRREGQNYLRLLWRKWQDKITHYGLLFLTWFLHLIWDVLAMSARLFVHLCAGMGETGLLWLSWLHNRLIRLIGREGWWNWWEKKSSAPPKSSEPTFPGGLTSNISLPATGDEAMKRLLACKGKDPYSILGVTNNCTDDDIKKYYKRQAVLVHPDKNSQPGAEEAFKILVHAFELIGEPERRSAYDRCVAETHQVEQAWSELSELLSQLHHKMEYAANTIRCTKCGKRHKRVIMQRPCYAARFCAQCKIHHSAREGDIWAESWLLGMLWHYYACMEGAVYDISEWAACQAENLKHLKANSHAVQYRIVLGKQNHHHHRKEDYNEPDLEEFLNNLYTQSDKGSGEGVSGGSNSTRQRRKGKRKK